MLYRHVFYKIATEFRSILRAFVNLADVPEFHGFATAQNIRSPELRHLHYTNWQLKICIWRLYFSSWWPKGNLRIFLISSPVININTLSILSIIDLERKSSSGNRLKTNKKCSSNKRKKTVLWEDISLLAMNSLFKTNPPPPPPASLDVSACGCCYVCW